MEAVFLVIVLVTALLVGVKNERHDPGQHTAQTAKSASEQSLTVQSPARLCDPTHLPIIQRDLTVPVDNKVNDDDH
ncbi:MAG: hypothetical protein H7A04_16120 [Pseudomonadales bacterium]|nr:hypothetical protein [Pseudomonadales bacterium]